mmetsp:Transcript_1831/g.1247  ORF Transcript_1831/g.1247 Transcript_1831/m.1247 type:complete len:210 (+) Transcript_1831:571-1200(+)
MTWPMEKAGSFTLMVISMKEIGSTTKLTVKVYICTWTELNILVTGWKTNSTAMVLRRGPMVHDMKETMNMVRSTATAHSSGVTLQCTWENSTTTIFMVRAYTCGMMDASIKVNGRTTKCMDTAHLLGVMVDATLVSTPMTRRMVMESFHGQMAGPTRVTGSTENSMAREFISRHKEVKSMENGKKENVKDGLKETHTNNTECSNSFVLL